MSAEIHVKALNVSSNQLATKFEVPIPQHKPPYNPITGTAQKHVDRHVDLNVKGLFIDARIAARTLGANVRMDNGYLGNINLRDLETRAKVSPINVHPEVEALAKVNMIGLDHSASKMIRAQLKTEQQLKNVPLFNDLPFYQSKIQLDMKTPVPFMEEPLFTSGRTDQLRLEVERLLNQPFTSSK